MFTQRSVMNALLCAIVLVASPLVGQILNASSLPQNPKPTTTQSASASTAAMPAQTDARPDYGTINAKHYVNGYFGFSYHYPEGWDGNVVQSSSTAATRMYTLFTANPSASNGSDMRYVSISVDTIGSNVTPKDFVEGALNVFAGPQGAFQTLHANKSNDKSNSDKNKNNPDKSYTFGGKQFYRIDMMSKPVPGSPTIYQTLVFTLLPNYAVTFSFMAMNPKDIEDLVHSMDTISFAPEHAAASQVREAKVVAQPK
ncbi:MAG TPA: hypothetical protein VK738_06175 [Terriglobales bacterium]|jgi:hypothetical protein|nr:hypothetical protein [Terriglobales bacterium]